MSLPPGAAEGLTDVTKLVEFAEQLPAAQQLGTDFERHSEKLSETFGATAHCYGVEICLDTWSADSILRLHGHLFLKHSFPEASRADHKILDVP